MVKNFKAIEQNNLKIVVVQTGRNKQECSTDLMVALPLGLGIQISRHSHQDHLFHSTTSNQLKYAHSHSWLPKNQEQQEEQSPQKW